MKTEGTAERLREIRIHTKRLSTGRITFQTLPLQFQDFFDDPINLPIRMRSRHGKPQQAAAAGCRRRQHEIAVNARFEQALPRRQRTVSVVDDERDYRAQLRPYWQVASLSHRYSCGGRREIYERMKEQ